MLSKQLEDLLKLSLQWVTAFLTLLCRIYRGQLDKETGELAVLTLLLLLAVWAEGTKLWVMTAYRCYELGKELRQLFSSSPVQVQQVTMERTEVVEEAKTKENTSSQPLHCLSSKALKQLARERKIKGYGSMTKAQLVAALS